MDRSLLVAAISGDEMSMKNMASQNPSLLLATTPQGNTCLHISSIHGHMRFCKEILALRLNDHNPLLATVNADGETPLLTAVTSGHPSLASLFLMCCHELKLSEAILKRDKNGCNALHHAIRSGHRELTLELIAAEPALSRAVNQYNESPMFIAVMRGLTDVFEKLLKTPGSADAGACGYNALHAAVKNGNSEKKPIVEAVVVGGGDAEVDAVKAVVDIEERRRRNRGKRSENIDAVKPPEPRRG